jgi:glycosyltransferase involved in cell wall biosynthesis
MKEIDLSIVIPVFNGAETIMRLVDALTAELMPRINIEVVLVNDGSMDDSLSMVRSLASRYPHVIGLDLARNFGEHNAVMAGLHAASGRYIAIMDDDMQNPPSEVMKLYDEIEKGYDVVFGTYSRKRHTRLRNLGSWFANAVANVMLKKPRDLYLSSFKILRAYVAKEIIKYSGPYPYIDGLVLSVTRNYSQIRVQHMAREAGKSNYTVVRLVRLWMNMFTNFSILPLRVAVIVGSFSALVAFVFLLYSIWEKIKDPSLPIGYAAIIVTVSFFSGMILIALGMIGEYLGRLFLFINRKPQFVVKETIKNA